jgi:hypothetical protein
VTLAVTAWDRAAVRVLNEALRPRGIGVCIRRQNSVLRKSISLRGYGAAFGVTLPPPDVAPEPELPDDDDDEGPEP